MILKPIDEVLVAEPVMFKRAAWRKPANDEVAAASVMLRAPEAKRVVVACEPVAFTKVRFWKVDEASERMPPVAVVRPVIPKVKPTVAEVVMEAELRVAVPKTAKVPVAVMLVVVRLVAMVEEETVRVPVITLLPRVSVLPSTSKMLPVVEVAEVPMRTTSVVSET